MKMLLKKIERVRKQADDHKLLQGYLNIIEEHITDSIMINHELHTRKFQKLKMDILQDIKACKYIRLVNK